MNTPNLEDATREARARASRSAPYLLEWTNQNHYQHTATVLGARVQVDFIPGKSKGPGQRKDPDRFRAWFHNLDLTVTVDRLDVAKHAAEVLAQAMTAHLHPKESTP